MIEGRILKDRRRKKIKPIYDRILAGSLDASPLTTVIGEPLYSCRVIRAEEPMRYFFDEVYHVDTFHEAMLPQARPPRW